jgi:hypothetical protein
VTLDQDGRCTEIDLVSALLVAGVIAAGWCSTIAATWYWRVGGYFWVWLAGTAAASVGGVAWLRRAGNTRWSTASVLALIVSSQAVSIGCWARALPPPFVLLFLICLANDVGMFSDSRRRSVGGWEIAAIGAGIVAVLAETLWLQAFVARDVSIRRLLARIFPTNVIGWAGSSSSWEALAIHSVVAALPVAALFYGLRSARRGGGTDPLSDQTVAAFLTMVGSFVLFQSYVFGVGALIFVYVLYFAFTHKGAATSIPPRDREGAGSS